MPQDVHPDYIAQLILENWHTLFPDCTTCPGIFYVDLWPMGPPTIFSEFPAEEFLTLLLEARYTLISEIYAFGKVAKSLIYFIHWSPNTWFTAVNF